ncbi:hypothetical protein SLEP1_g21188 [Rubroshorea leprosula]|uniref:Reverse transcriptase Ty1/copia-type domain-containing protein n=1 Tax=Rubroshorea leprosula TaxID=152421 RepID=A0AAV5J8C1_9ROSI|nr:hypothetical protein SLEP1_g21188 [Rubroshorea leprosula]
MTTLWKDNDSLTEYLRKFKAICDELAAMGKLVPDKTKAFWVLQGLGQGYENFVTTMLKPSIPPYREVVSLLKSHETRNQIHGFETYNHPQMAFYGQRTNGNQNKRKGNGFNKFNSNGTNSTYNSASANYFYHAGNRNVGSNFTRNQPNNLSKQKVEAQNPIMDNVVKCQICGKLNHIALKCFNRFNHSYQEDDIPNALAATTIDDNQELEWHPDTGASVHMTGNSSKPNNLKPYHGQDAVMVGIPIEPKSVRLALKHQGWTIAMHEELEALAKNDTWDLVPRTKDMNVIGYKWVFKTKLHANGSLKLLKACLVAKGFHQIAGVDFSETFSPVVTAGTIRTILAIATTKQWQIRQLDVKNTFLHGYLNEPVYMEQQPGFLDPKCPTHLGQEFAIKDLGRLNFFLSIEVHYTSLSLILSQSNYALDILVRAPMEGCNSISTPMALKARSSHSSNDAFHDPTHYRSIVGTLQYLTFTRPDLSFVVNYVCQFMNSPTIGNYQTVKRKLSNCISWCAMKQPTVAHSSAEAEYRSMASTTAEITWLANLLHDIGMALNNAPILLYDNLSAIYMTINPVFHSRTKHVEIDYHFVREKVALGHLITQFGNSTSQLANIFIKPLTRDSFHRLRNKLGLASLPLPNLRGSNKVSTYNSHGNALTHEDHCVEPFEGNKSNGNNALEENQQSKIL